MSKLEDLTQKGRKTERKEERACNIVIEHTVYSLTDTDYHNYLVGIAKTTSATIAEKLRIRGMASFATSNPSGLGAMVTTYTKITIPAADEKLIKTLDS